MNPKQRSSKMIGLVCLLWLTALTLAACNMSIPKFSSQQTPNDGKVSICHANGKTDSPYDLLSLDLTQLSEHSKHPNDIIPVPSDGCPAELQENVNDGKITICHATGSNGNPYSEITIAFSGLNGHAKHTSDLIPAPADGCPTTLATPTITLTPTITTTPEATTVGDDGDKKITICHATGGGNGNGKGKDKGIKYVMITISVNGLNGHSKHPLDIIPAPAGGCP